ncbi:transcription antitermination factor NusB [Alysiella filiformis]|uniref:Transcription antitermination protein NusB n=1 Tax=Alysiella filiformis DSM 16848 TaxID=1120981 RepID=A0A286EBM3_9NEIS|nr:transcription antitermination factor NusB [Alysiella filiformis]QMT31313.1 transcription antitermination factor NusB [Alysiella filiformis]UBQ55681.1 transcription antitermination factor NusB [Alysiella filiformis DSM 16848]SOD68335.1 NusB antitermination factor [Alysiella filiformis DSM 16848]
MTEPKRPNKSPRRRAREFAVQALYQSMMNQNTPLGDIANHLREHTDFKNADKELFNRLFLGASHNQSDYMQQIVPHLDRDEKMINPIERAILLMATHELNAMLETPHAVIINEAIEVTKTFGGTDSHKFINGILDKLAAQLRPAKQPESEA